MKKLNDVNLKIERCVLMYKDFALAIIQDADGNRIGLREWCAVSQKAQSIMLPDNKEYKNLTVKNGQLNGRGGYEVADFPVLEAGKPQKGAGAWIMDIFDDGSLRLISVGGSVKDVDGAVAAEFHNQVGIVGAFVTGGRLIGRGVRESLVKWRGDETNGIVLRRDKMFYPRDFIEIAVATVGLGAEDFFDTLVSDAGIDNEDIPNDLSQQTTVAIGQDQEAMDAVLAFAGRFEPALYKIWLQNKAKILSNELSEANTAYHNATPIMTDLEFDKKYDELTGIEDKLGVKSEVTTQVGAAPTGRLMKYTHPERMLSLDKTKDISALTSLLTERTGVISWKLDGISIVATYMLGELVRAVTRGDGKVGEVVTHNAKYFEGLPTKIAFKGALYVAGEATISFAEFQRINANLPAGVDKYKNPRNLASGTVRRSEITTSGVQFSALRVLAASEVSFYEEGYYASLQFLKGQGFNIVEAKLCNENTIEEAVEEFRGRIENFGIPTDGLVLTLNDIQTQEALGTTGKHPRWALAFKWKDEVAKTILREVIWSGSRTGALTPVAVFDPVDLEGTTVERASVHNLSELQKHKLGIGDTISVYKANMIIPQIAENHTGSGTVTAPATCPVCAAATTIRQSDIALVVMCPNRKCMSKKVGLLEHFVKRDAMNIDGISAKTAESLVEAGFISKPVDFFRLKDKPQIADLSGWGASSFIKMIDAIEAARDVELGKFIYSLGMEGVGRSASAALAAHFKDLNKFLSAPKSALLEVTHVGDKMADVILDYVADYMLDIQELAGEVRIQAPKEAPSSSKALVGLTFCVTGKLDFEGGRSAFQTFIASHGGDNASSVSARVTHLVTNTPNSGTSKNRKAVELGTKVITEAELMRMVREGAGV
jgi:DNA ligase (NAD+)